MKKLSFLIVLALFFQFNAFSQPCLPDGITFSTQAQIDNFQTNYPNCTEIEGNVGINGSDISNINGLSVLTSFGADLEISNTYSLTSFSGLNNVTSIGGNLSIQGIDALTNLTGLHNVTSIGGDLGIENNYELTSITGLDNLISIGGTLSIKHNHSLINLTGLDNVATIGGNLEIGTLIDYIAGNEYLSSLTGLEGLTSIGGDLLIYRNEMLISLTGLNNLSFIGGVLSIIGNASLSSCEAQWLCDYLSNPSGPVNIFNNPPGCNNPLEIANACGIDLPCLPYGNYYLFNQMDIDNFQTNYPNCTEIDGNITIYGLDITNLNGLSVVNSIGGDLHIGGSGYLGNSSLKSLSGLEGITSIGGDLLIYNNDSLTSLSGLDNVASINGDIYIGYQVETTQGLWHVGNPSLINLTGLEGLTSTEGDLSIKFNNSLTSLAGLESLTSIGGNLKIGDMFYSFPGPGNSNLTSLTGLEGLTSIGGGLSIESNDALITLTGLDNVTSIGGDLLIYGNDSLTSLLGLDNVTSVNGKFHIGRYSDWDNQYGNPNLTNLTALEGLTSIGGDLWIEENDALPSLTGLEGLTSIEGALEIFSNTALTNLIGLDNVTSITGSLYVGYNASLTSLTGLDNMTSIGGDLSIRNNVLLSSCEAQGLCNYLSNPNGSVNIYSNAPGCNNPAEIANACGIVLPCLPYGNYYFSTQTEIDNFPINYPNCTILAGDIYILGDDITNLSGLSVLTSVEGYIEISGNNALTSLTGLDNVTSIGGDLRIIGDDALSDLSGLDNVTVIGGDFRIIGNDALSDLSGLNNLTSIMGDLYISGNSALESLSGLENVISIGGTLTINQNLTLTSLTGLDNLDASSINGLIITWNTLLSNCAEHIICEYLASPNASISVHSNAPGCSNKYEIEDECAANCFPDGVVFTTQAEIDDFADIFPNCIKIGGDMTISGEDISNLYGLNALIFIGGNLEIDGNDNLFSLDGLNDLHEIDGGLSVKNNPNLTNLNDLSNVTSINGFLQIENNTSISSLLGLHNINPLLIQQLSVVDNTSLSTCDVVCVCEYLASSNATVSIQNNAPGCNSPNEVEEKCEDNCLVEGLNITTQEQIDNFQINYPNCSDIIGNVWIHGSDITDLSGLSGITSIGGNLKLSFNPALVNLAGLNNVTFVGGTLWMNNNYALSSLSGLESLNSVMSYFLIVSCNALTTLSGLDNLTSVGGLVKIHHNDQLISLQGLNSLTTVGGNITIHGNDVLSSLSGLDNIEVNSIQELYITSNSSLTSCAVQSICEYIDLPIGGLVIQDNAPGCNSPEEVEEACAFVSVENVYGTEGYSVYPNPVTGIATFSSEEITSIELYDMMGALIIKRNSNKVDMSNLNPGIYFVIGYDKNNTPLYTGKVIKK